MAEDPIAFRDLSVGAGYRMTGGSERLCGRGCRRGGGMTPPPEMTAEVGMPARLGMTAGPG